MREAFEQHLMGQIANSTPEKSYVDKILAKADVERIVNLVKKDGLTRGELLEILHSLHSIEAKMVNLDENTRYILLKYYTWIQDLCLIAEGIFDYEQDLEKKEKKLGEGVVITPYARQMFYNNKRIAEHTIKFMVGSYLNILRTSLSIGATGFLELLTNKFELAYPQRNETMTPIQEEKKGFLGMFK